MNKAQPYHNRKLPKPQNNAARERSRVKTLRSAFLDLQKSLPAVPPNTKLSKLDVLVLATTYIYHLTKTLERRDHPSDPSSALLHPSAYQGASIFYRHHQALARVGRQPARGCHINLTPSVAMARQECDRCAQSLTAADTCSSGGQQCNISIFESVSDKRRETTNQADNQPLCLKAGGILRPVKKWPMRTRLYDSILGATAKGVTSTNPK